MLGPSQHLCSVGGLDLVRSRSCDVSTVRRMSGAAGPRERVERIDEALSVSERQELADDIEDTEAQAPRFEAVVERGERGSAAP